MFYRTINTKMHPTIHSVLSVTFLDYRVINNISWEEFHETLFKITIPNPNIWLTSAYTRYYAEAIIVTQFNLYKQASLNSPAHYTTAYPSTTEKINENARNSMNT